MAALRSRQEHPIFSTPYWEADTHLVLSIQALNAHLTRSKRIKDPLHIASAIRYAEQVCRPRIGLLT